MLFRRVLASGGGVPFTSPPGPFALFAAADAGAGTEVTGPRAHFDGTDRTFMGWVTGNSDPNQIEVAAYVHSTGAKEGPVRLTSSPVSGGSTTTPDSHVGPAMCINGAGKLVVAWAPHQGTTITVKISNAAIGAGWVASGFGSPITFTPTTGTFTYPQLSYCSTNERIYLTYRRVSGSTAQLIRCHSDDGGATWSAGTAVYTSSGDNEYSAFACNGVDRIDFAITDDEPAQAGGFGLFYFYMEAVSGDLRAADGTLLKASASLPAVPADLTQLVATTGDQYPYAVAYASGQPVISWQTKNQDPVRFGEFRWSGSAWVETQIGTSEPISPSILTVGGGHHVWSDTDRYFHGRVVSSVQTIWEYRRSGGTWDTGRQLAATGTTPHSPFQVRANGAGLASLWTIGTNVSDDNFDPGLAGAA